MFKKLVFIALLSVLTNVAYADCSYEGKVYPEGTVIGPLVCSGNNWVKR